MNMEHLGSPQPRGYDLLERLAYMQEHGSSVLLNWVEDNNLWECSWITGGERFSGYRHLPEDAVNEAIANAKAKYPITNESAEGRDA